MNDLTRILLDRDDLRTGQVVYGVASGSNTVAVRGVSTPVEMPALNPVKSGDYCAVWESGGDRLILGAVGGSGSGIYTDSGASIPNNSATAITLTASSDPRGWLSSGNVSPDVAGKYKVTVDVHWPSGAYNRTSVQIRKNNTNVTGGLSNVADVSSGNSTNTVVAVVDMNGSSDQIDCELFQDSGSAQSPVDVLFLVEFLPGH